MKRKEFMNEFFHSRRRRNLSISDFDAYVLEDINKATTNAKTILGVDDFVVNEFSPVLVSTPAANSDILEPVIVFSEDKMRYDIANFNALFFGSKFLFHYSCMIDHKTGASFNHHTVEVPYSEIKAIETSSRFELIEEIEHHVFDITLILDNYELVVPLRTLLVDIKTEKKEYLIPKDLLDLMTSLKAFLRKKIAD